MINQINKEAHGGGHKHIRELSIDEIQSLCKQIVIDGSMCKKVEKFLHLITTRSSVGKNNM